MVAGFVCLMATLAIRGLWLDGKGFKIDMEEENVVLSWLARGRHALGQSLMKGIKWDAILTFLLNNSLHRSNQGRWVQNLPKIVNHDVRSQSDVKAVVGRGDNAKLKETCNGVVWSMCDQGLTKNDLN